MAYCNLADAEGKFGTNIPLMERYSLMAVSAFEKLNDSNGYSRSVLALAHALWGRVSLIRH